MFNFVDGGEFVYFLVLKLVWDVFVDVGYLDRFFNCDKIGVILGWGIYVNWVYNFLM